MLSAIRHEAMPTAQLRACSFALVGPLFSTKPFARKLKNSSGGGGSGGAQPSVAAMAAAAAAGGFANQASVFPSNRVVLQGDGVRMQQVLSALAIALLQIARAGEMVKVMVVAAVSPPHENVSYMFLEFR